MIWYNRAWKQHRRCLQAVHCERFASASSRVSSRVNYLLRKTQTFVRSRNTDFRPIVVICFAKARRLLSASRVSSWVRAREHRSASCCSKAPRPISLLRLSLLRLLDSNFTGNPLVDMRIPPLEIKILLESNPPRSGISVRRMAVHCNVAQRPARNQITRFWLNSTIF